VKNLGTRFKHSPGSHIFIEVLDELELFIDKKVIFDEKKNVRLSAVCQQIL
jgi:hypothetical protein